MDELKKELDERMKQLSLLKERLAEAKNDRKMFLKKLEEMENGRA